MLTRAGYALGTAALALLTLGLALASPYHLAAALVLLTLLAVGASLDRPHPVHARLEVDAREPRVGDTVDVTITYEVPRGQGFVELHVPVPDVFEVVDGRNLHVVRKRPGRPLAGTFRFRVRCTRRGHHTLGPLTAESVHGAGLLAAAEADAAPAVELTVRPPHAPVRRIRGLTGRARDVFPQNDLALQGVQTTDFRELREYANGDPLKLVNWKATSRVPGVAEGLRVPLVNEYEREGRKSVWLFVDAAPHMQVGSTREDGFEHAIAAAHGVAEFYLERGYRLGAYVYNAGSDALLHAEGGRRQRLRLHHMLTEVQPGRHADEGLLGALERVRAHLHQEKPLIVLVTRLGRADERTFDALRKLRTLSGRSRRRIPVLIVSVQAHTSIPGDAEYEADVAHLLRRAERPQHARARRVGARVVEWDPTTTRLERVLLHAGGRGR